MNESLAHHGILGQKWGVRRYQNPDGSLTSSGKKRYYGDYSVKKNEALKRITAEPLDAQHINRVYVSDDKDHRYYQEFSSDFVFGQRAYDVSYSATKDLKIAGPEKVAAIALEVMNSDATLDAKRLDSKNDTDSVSNYLFEDLGINPEMLELEKRTEEGQKIIDYLIEDGYDGMVDTIDKYYIGVTDKPAVIFNPSDNLKIDSIRDIGYSKYDHEWNAKNPTSLEDDANTAIERYNARPRGIEIPSWYASYHIRDMNKRQQEVDKALSIRNRDKKAKKESQLFNNAKNITTVGEMYKNILTNKLDTPTMTSVVKKIFATPRKFGVSFENMYGDEIDKAITAAGFEITPEARSFVGEYIQEAYTEYMNTANPNTIEQKKG